MEKIEVYQGDIQNVQDQRNMLEMLAAYMKDPMGGEKDMSDELAQELIERLTKQCNYVFFLARVDGKPAGIANCFIGFSTFKAKQLLNIHDFAVHPDFRRRGIGEALMKKIFSYAKLQNMCRVNLEVRHDNHGAQKLYQKVGFVDSEPPMYFWEREL